MGDSMTHRVSMMSSAIDDDDNDGFDEDPPEIAIREWSESNSSDEEEAPPIARRQVKRIARKSVHHNSNISTSKSSKRKNYDGPTKAELDSHADTCSFGSQAYIVEDTGQTISVSGFLSSLGTVKHVPIVTAAIAYDDPITYQTFILFFHQSLYFKKMDK